MLDEPRLLSARMMSFLRGPSIGRGGADATVTFQAYVDESGGKGQSRAFVFSALIGGANMWSKFSNEWGKVLASPPRIEYFKMREAANLSGEFHRFSCVDRDQKLRELATLVGRTGLMELFCAMDLAGFEITLAAHSEWPMSDPYFYPFHIVIMALGEQLLELKVQDPFEVFFDDNLIFGPRAKAWYPIIRAAFPDDLRAIAPVEPFFRSDKTSLPLQAADLTAWLHRRSYENANDEFAWVGDELKGLIPAPQSQVLDTRRMEKMVLLSYSPETIARVKEATEVYRGVFGDRPKRWKKKRKRR